MQVYAPNRPFRPLQGQSTLKEMVDYCMRSARAPFLVPLSTTGYCQLLLYHHWLMLTANASPLATANYCCVSLTTSGCCCPTTGYCRLLLHHHWLLLHHHWLLPGTATSPLATAGYCYITTGYCRVLLHHHWLLLHPCGYQVAAPPHYRWEEWLNSLPRQHTRAAYRASELSVRRALSTCGSAWLLHPFLDCKAPPPPLASGIYMLGRFWHG